MYGLEGIEAGGGFPLMIVGLIVVFSALVLLLFLMKGLKRSLYALHQAAQRRQAAEIARKTTTGEGLPAPGVDHIEGPGGEDIPGVVIAAIAMTLLLESEQVHDNESMVLTLQNLPKPYSNWWQNRIDPAWRAAITKGRPSTLQTQDPERGTDV